MIWMDKYTDSYLTVSEETRCRIPVGKCRFIASVAPVAAENKAQSFIERIREEFPDASHHVYAYRVIAEEEILEKHSDDREPPGTGGSPVMGVIHKADLCNTVIVVTRYFGGVKHGVGGLKRAYRAAAAEGLNNTRIIRRERFSRLVARVSYEGLGLLMNFISSSRGEVLHIDYGDEVKVQLCLRAKDKDVFAESIYAATRGQAVLEKEGGGR